MWTILSGCSLYSKWTNKFSIYTHIYIYINFFGDFIGLGWLGVFQVAFPIHLMQDEDSLASWYRREDFMQLLLFLTFSMQKFGTSVYRRYVVLRAADKFREEMQYWLNGSRRKAWIFATQIREMNRNRVEMIERRTDSYRRPRWWTAQHRTPVGTEGAR